MGDTKQEHEEEIKEKEEVELEQKQRTAIDIYGTEVAERVDLDDIIDDMLSILPRVEEEYLVSGARLKCSKAYKAMKKIDDTIFLTNQKGTSLLRVEGVETTGDLPIANINDNKKGKNIFHFGNCNAELTINEKMSLIMNKKAQTEGLCQYLMRIEDTWENVPVTNGKDYFSYRGASGINLMSKLFCYKKGWITPLTSGQRNRKITVQPGAVTKEDLRFALENGLSGKQLYALADIRNYFAADDDLYKKTTIFAFEGLGSDSSNYFEEDYGEISKSKYWNGGNKYHPDGQFRAILFVAKEGKLTYVAPYASTLPDNMEKAATICDGKYEIRNGSHKGYAALVLNNDNDIPAYNSIDQDDTADHIHFHMAGLLSDDDPENPYSAGCITIPVRHYVAFGKHVGFISEGTDDSIGSDNIYKKAKPKLEYFANTKEFEGYMVIDRKYYSDTEGYLKFNAPKEGK